MNDAPLWLQASLVLFFVGGFLLVLCASFWLIELLPPVERFLDRMLGGDE